jgi:hypothetical protein
MVNERRIEKWNARWMIAAGRAVCTGCLKSQALEERQKPFSHVPTCEAGVEKVIHPWIALHDNARYL